MALVAGYARRLFGEAEVRHSLALDRISRLAEANALLFSLHRVAQSLPASLDLDEVLESTIARMRELVEFQVVVILLGDASGADWTVGASEGVRLPTEIADSELPAAARMAVTNGAPYAAPHLGGTQGAGLAGMSGSGVYAPLWAREQLVGILVLEHGSPGRLGARRRACSLASSSPRRWPSTTPGGSPACAPSAPTRSAPASPATSTTASASRWPTWPSSSTAS